MKIVKIGTEARNELIRGANFLADAVKSTVGPFGSNFALEKGMRITNDGATVAREIELKDETQNLGIRILREAVIKTNDKVGDGTTTAAILSQAILAESVRFLGDDQAGLVAKKSGPEIIRQIEAEKAEIIKKLDEMATPIETKEDLIHSAVVSVEDEKMGELIGSAQWELGKDGILIAEEIIGRDCSVERVMGIKIDNGFTTSLLLNNPEKQTLEVENTKVILTNSTITFSELNTLKTRVIDPLVKAGVTTFVIMARAFDSTAIQVCLNNINQGGVKIYPVNAPYIDQTEIMKDLAAVLGANFYHVESSNLGSMVISDVGFSPKIIAGRWSATITGEDSEPTRERVIKRVEELKKSLTAELSDFEKRNINQRIAQLTNGFSIIKVGGTSETARKYLKDKVDDAVNAVRWAFQEGVVPGAGLAFRQIAETLPSTYLLKRPLMALNEQIMFNAPKDWTIPEWVKDPVKVLKVALEEACSVSATLATAIGATAEERPKSKYVEVQGDKE